MSSRGHGLTAFAHRSLDVQNLVQVERKFPPRHIVKKRRLGARDAVRFHMRAGVVDDLVQRGKVAGEQRVDTPLLDRRAGVFCRLGHGVPPVRGAPCLTRRHAADNESYPGCGRRARYPARARHATATTLASHSATWREYAVGRSPGGRVAMKRPCCTVATTMHTAPSTTSNTPTAWE